jgi:6-phosphogluconolactonase (cycloisomerase 2 family)
VTISQQPPGGNCTLQNGSGTATANVTNIAVTCTPPPATGSLVLTANTGSNTLSIFRDNNSLGTATTGAGPFSIAVTPNGRNAYVSNQLAGSILSYTIDSRAGTLSPIPASSPNTVNPFGLGMDPLGRFLWVANYSADAVSAFSIDAATGALTPQGSVPSARSPYSIAAHPGRNFVYAAAETGAVSIYNVNSATGALTAIGAPLRSELGAHQISITPNGFFAYVAGTSSISSYSIDTASGALTQTGRADILGEELSNSAHPMAVHPNGLFLYVSNANSLQSFFINSGTGALTAIGSKQITGLGTSAIALDATGARLYLVNETNNTVSTFSVDGVTGAATPIAIATTGSGPQSVIAIP